MNGGGTDTLNNNIATKEVRLKDTLSGIDNSSKISTTTNVLTLDSVGPNATATSTQFALRNTANTVITPLQLTSTINNMSVPLDMTGGNSALSTVRCRFYNFKILGTGAATNSSISLDNTNMILDNQQLNSSMEFRTRTSGGTQVTSLRIESSQMFSNVALDMTNNNISDIGYLNASVRSRIYLLRDLETAAITSCGMYFSSNNLQIDSDSGVESTDTAMFLRTKKASDGTLTNALQLTNTTIKTDCYAITPLSTRDDSNTIPTTAWVQSAITASIPTSLTTPTLSQVLVTGNSAGSTGINMNNNPISNVGILTTTNAIDMIGSNTSSTVNNNISTKEIRLKDTFTEIYNGTSIRTLSSFLSIDSVGPSGVPTATRLTTRTSANKSIDNLILLSTGNHMYIPLNMNNQNITGINTLSFSTTTQNRAYTGTGAGTYTNTNMTIDANGRITDISSGSQQLVKRAFAYGTSVSESFINFTINISNSGFAAGWSQNQMVSFRVNFNQEAYFSNGVNQSFTNTSCILNLYPGRFTTGWLTQTGAPTGQYSRGQISTNLIFESESNHNYFIIDNEFCPFGRQFWAYNLNYVVAGTTSIVARLNISGAPQSINQVNITVINPPGISSALSPQHFNISLELINPSNISFPVTTSGFSTYGGVDIT